MTQAQCLLPWLQVDSEPGRAKGTCQGQGDAATPSPTCPSLQDGVVVTCFCDKSLVLSPFPCLVPPPMPKTDLHLLSRDSVGGCTGSLPALREDWVATTMPSGTGVLSDLNVLPPPWMWMCEVIQRSVFSGFWMA